MWKIKNRRKSWRVREKRRGNSEKAKRIWASRHANGTATWGIPDDGTPRRVPEGTLIGVLTWHATSGEVIRCPVRQGKRANGILVGSKQCGWDYLLRKVRKRLSMPKRICP